MIITLLAVAATIAIWAAISISRLGDLPEELQDPSDLI